MFLSTSKEVWETVWKTYLKMDDVILMFKIKSKTTSTKQTSFSVTEYYNTLNGLWLELDHYQNMKMKDNKDAQALKNLLKEIVYLSF